MKADRVLVIDDESIVRDTITAYLEDSGFEVIEAANGADGVHLFDEVYPDIVLCDLRMPMMDGLDVLNYCMTKRPEIPFIVLSGAGVMSDVVDALRLGASDYLFKPLSDLAVLEHSINKNLERSRLRHDLEAYRHQLEISNAQLESELSAGRILQQKMLPSADLRLGGWHFEYHVRASHYLSGDFVDYVPISETRIFFYMVDVSGHGVSSALVTLLIKNFMDMSLPVQKNSELPDLADLTRHLNAHLINLGLERHATLFSAILDVEQEYLWYCCAAQFPTPVVLRKSGIESLPIQGMAVGLFPEADYLVKGLELSDVDGMFMCSDGILEILDESSLKEKEDALLALVTASGNSVRQFSESVRLNEVEGLPDDITILTLNRCE